MATKDVLDEFSWRGLLHQCNDADRLRAHLAGGRRRAYVGFDPTADSLTIGNLVQIVRLAHLQRLGHEPVVLMGGGTGAIGDPSGRSSERELLSVEQIEANVAGQRRIFDFLLPGAPVINNWEWLSKLGYLTVLRDVGKHFSVNAMIQRDSVRDRLAREHGISYTEFSYMILQAYDFAHLYAHHEVTIQMGGSDQWGNIVSGVDLVRRLHHGIAFALTSPLVTKADGAKFGKSESGAIWLTADRTSSYAFHQFWLNSDDADAMSFLRFFTFLDRDEIADLERAHADDPAGRLPHRALANEVTSWLHGADAARRAEAAGRALFSGAVRELDAGSLADVFADVASSTHRRERLLAPRGEPLIDVLVESGVAPSRRQAREWLSSGSIAVNGERVGENYALTERDLLHGGTTVLLRRGKKNWHVTRWD